MKIISSAIAASEGGDALHLEPAPLRAFESVDGNLVETAELFSKFCRKEGVHIRCFFETRRSSVGKLLDNHDVFVRKQEKADQTKSLTFQRSSWSTRTQQNWKAILLWALASITSP